MWVQAMGDLESQAEELGLRVIGHPFHSHPLTDLRKSQEYGPV